MGKVYKAHDATLDRHVAIKILPAELVKDASRVGRFIQEARAASALNHPHVLTVYDIGEADEVRYIAMELIDGKTVREQLLSGKADLRKSLKLVLQVAEALTAAHAAGIVHRDLKPENIMVTPAGYAKVLDFGLAKLRAGNETRAGESESKTAVRQTEPGMVMGTVGYMSPEQARGEAVDQRSDIFSLGCVLYELVSGRRAFSGDSSVDTLHRILYSEPEPVRTVRAEAPPELARIIRKTLAKDPNDRYQSARDLAIDLRELLREIDSNPSGAIEPLPPAKPVRNWLLPWVGVILAVIAAAAVSWIWRGRSAAPAAPVADQLRVTRVTASGKVIAAAISPDGKFVAYNVSDQGEQSLWVRQMGSGQSLELIPMGRRAYWGLSFSPDGDIFFGEKRGDSGGAIHRISPLGGTPRKIIENIESPPTFSPDGKQLAFLRARFPTPTESSIIIADIDGSREKVLASVKLPDLFVPVFFGGASWSPDGKQIATALINRTKRSARVIGVEIASGEMTTISDAPWVQVAQVAWMPDGQGLVAIGFDGEDSRNQVWYLPYPKGAPVQITNDLFDYRIVSLTADGKSLLTVASDAAADVWMIPDGGEPKKLTKAKLEGAYGVDALPDGRIVFTSLETGKLDVWSMNPDGNDRTLLTRDEHENRRPVASPDGRFIVYVSMTSSSTDICRMDVDGSNRRVLATGVTPQVAISVSPDSKWVAYHVSQGSTFNIARVPAEGGAPVFLTEEGATTPMYSPDGSQLAAYFHEGGRWFVGILPAEGGKPSKRFEVAPATTSSKIDWMADGSAVVINTAPSDRANLWRIPIDGSPPARITNFDEHLIMAYARLPNGKGWIVSRGDLSRDAVLITGFRP
jgi:eukaryotic-like serine/threonine-protein kinase